MTIYDDLKLNYLFTDRVGIATERFNYSVRNYLSPVVEKLEEEHQLAFRMQCLGYLSQMLFEYVTGIKHEHWSDLYNKKSGTRKPRCFYPFYQNNQFTFGFWVNNNQNIFPAILPKNQIHTEEFGKLRLDFGIKNENNIHLYGCNTAMWVYTMNCICGEILPIQVSLHKRNSEPMSKLFQDNVFILSITDEWYKKYTLIGTDEINLYIKNSWFAYNRKDNTSYIYISPILGKVNRCGYTLVLEWYANDGIFQQTEIDAKTRYEHLRRILECPEKL